jgi:hypothetical protein
VKITRIKSGPQPPSEEQLLEWTRPKAGMDEEELAHTGSTRFASFIRAITQSGFVRDENQFPVDLGGVSYVTYRKKSLPPLEFEYSKAIIQDDIQDLPAGIENLPIGIDGRTYQWVDLEGEGVPGILTEQAGAWYYKPNQGGGSFGPLHPNVAETLDRLFASAVPVYLIGERLTRVSSELPTSGQLSPRIFAS